MSNPSVAFLTRGILSWASTRFRAAWIAEARPDVFQWFHPEENLDGKLGEFKALVFQKRQSATDLALARAAKQSGIKVIIDLTDPMWWFDPAAVGAMIDVADAVTVASEGLGRAVAQMGYTGPIAWIDDRMQPEYHPTRAKHGTRETVTLGWFGQSSNRIGLVGALPILTYVANLGHKIKLRIIDDDAVNRMNINGPLEVEYVPWALETFHAQLCACDIAVLPPYPGPWGDLKSNNRAVSAYWCGLPVVDGYDPAELIDLIVNPMKREQVGKANRAKAEAEYGIDKSVGEWLQLLGELGVDYG